jgi:hypothetical protein
MGWASTETPISHSLLDNVLRRGTVSHLLAYRHTIPDIPAVEFALQISDHRGQARDLALARCELLKELFPQPGSGMTTAGEACQTAIERDDATLAFRKWVAAVSIAYSGRVPFPLT